MTPTDSLDDWNDWDENPFASHQYYTQIQIECDHSAIAALEALFEDKNPLSFAHFEKDKGKHWQVEVLLAGKDISLSTAGINGIRKVSMKPLEMRDWVTENQKDFPPLEIGNFYIHGSHLLPKAGKVINLQIDAGRAFGTGEHATTAGCLQAMQQMFDAAQSFNNIIDIGCGTGILAMGATRLWPQAKVMGSDLDPQSVITAEENAAHNRIESLTFLTANGTQHDEIQASAPYDLLIANILAQPLIMLAPDISAIAGGKSTLILSGLLQRQEEEVLAAYLAQGWHCSDKIHREEWSALVLTKGSAV